jgi:signal peptidase II
VHHLPAGQRAAAQKQTVTPPVRPSGTRPGRTSVTAGASRLAPWLISVVTFGADQLTKLLVDQWFAPGESLPLVHPILHLTYVQNRGAAFGLFQGRQALFIVLALAVIAGIGRELLLRPSASPAVRWGCGLVLGGVAGNLLDRLRFGYVVDFIDLRVWPVFNVGDSAITIGVALLVLHSVFGGRKHVAGRKRHVT